MFESTVVDDAGHRVAGGDRRGAIDIVSRSAVDDAFARVVGQLEPLGRWVPLVQPEHRGSVALPVCEAVPGPELASRLASVDRVDTGDEELVDRVVAWQRLASWVASAQAADVDELVSRRAGSREQEFVVDEVAAALTATRGAAARILDLGVGLRVHRAVGAALAEGKICERRARVLIEAAPTVPLADRVELVESLVEEAGAQTAPRLRDLARRREISYDPAAAEARPAEARARRGVFFEPMPDAMARVSACLPAEDALAIWRTVDQLARLQPADARSADERRADTLTDLVLETGPSAAPADTSRPVDEPKSADARCARTPVTDAGFHGGRVAGARRSAQVRVSVPFAALAGLTEEPAELAGYGPIPATLARELAADATWTRLLTDPADGRLLDVGTTAYRPPAGLRAVVEARDITCCFPGCRVPAARCDVDHVAPYDPLAPPGAVPQTRASYLQALCRHHHRLKTHGEWGVHKGELGRTTWTAPTGHVYTRSPETFRSEKVPAASRTATPEIAPPAPRVRPRAGLDPGPEPKPDLDRPPF